MQAKRERERYVRKGKRGGHKQAILISLMLVIHKGGCKQGFWTSTKMDFDSPALHNLFTSC